MSKTMLDHLLFSHQCRLKFLELEFEDNSELKRQKIIEKINSYCEEHNLPAPLNIDDAGEHIDLLLTMELNKNENDTI